MGNNLFGANIAGIIASVIGPSVLPATLVHKVPGTRGANPSAGTNPTESTHGCRAFIDDYKDEGLIQKGYRKITILGDTIAPAAIPVPADEITLTEPAVGRAVTYTIAEGGVKRDPDAATYECQARVT